MKVGDILYEKRAVCHKNGDLQPLLDAGCRVLETDYNKHQDILWHYMEVPWTVVYTNDPKVCVVVDKPNGYPVVVTKKNYDSTEQWYDPEYYGELSLRETPYEDS